MKIYIASSWKNQHGVEMLTAALRSVGHEVISWVENCQLEGQPHFQLEEWMTTDQSIQCFEFDTNGATKSDLVIYYGPAGKDACAEMGAAWAAKVPIIGLYAKGEDLGLMRKMANHWCSSVAQLFDTVNFYAETVQCPKPKSITMLYNELMDRAKSSLPIKNVKCKCGGSVNVRITDDRAFFECSKCGNEVVR